MLARFNTGLVVANFFMSTSHSLSNLSSDQSERFVGYFEIKILSTESLRVAFTKELELTP